MNENNNMNPTQFNSNQNVYPQNNNPKKESPAIAIAIITIILLAIAAIVIVLFLNKDNKKEQKSNTNTQQNNTNTNNSNKSEIAIKWNGIYENNGDTIILYQYNEKELNYLMNINNHNFSGHADIDKNIATGEIFDTYTFTLNENSIEFTTTNKEINPGTFQKTKEYSKEDFFHDNFGDDKYLSGTINGIFEKDNITIKIYQSKEDKAYIIINSSNYAFSRDISIVNGTLVLEGEFLGDSEKINVTFTNDGLTITASSSKSDSILNKASGTYKKIKPYTMDEIINDGI